MVRKPRGARRTREHPSHRMPPLLRPALYRGHRTAGLQGADLGRGRYGRGLSRPRRRRLRPRRDDRAGDLPRRQGGGRAAGSGAHAQCLSRPSRFAAGKLFRLHPAARDRRSARARRQRGGGMILPPNPVSLIPESAPFTAEQRVWLSGLFAGLLSLEGGVTPLSPEQAAALLSGASGVAAPPGANTEDDGAPWHDPAMPLDDRMKLAEGRPLRRRMMAAMGQQDCGQCGYTCQDYSDAIFLEKEERLNLCVPGGKETTRMLKALHHELGQAPADKTRSETPTPAAATVAPATAPGWSRECPAEATFLSRTRLNKPGSEKETWHVEFDLTATGIDYAVGDAFGVFPTNDPALADAVIAALAAPPDFPIGGRPLRDVLIDGVSLGAAPDMLFSLFSYITGGERRQK